MDFSTLLVCRGVCSVWIGLASAFFELSSGSRTPWSFLVWSLGCFLCPLLDSFWWFCIILRTLFVVYRWRFPPFLVVSSSGLVFGDDIVDISGLLMAFATLDAPNWIMSVMVSLMVSTSSSSCRVLNWFLNSSCNLFFFDPICVHLLLVALLHHVFLSTSTPSLMLLMTILWSLTMLSWLMTVTSVTISGLFVRDPSILVFFISSVHSS